MQVFVIETVTGGGLSGKTLPDALIDEGMLMRDALIGDLEDLPGVRVVTTHDPRVPPPARGHSVPINDGDDPLAVWANLAGQSHCSWPIAPESGGELARLVERLAATGTRVIGPDLATVRLCSSKRATGAALAAAGIRTVTSYPADRVPADLAPPVVLKPDDGAGCIETYLLDRIPDDIAGRAGFIVEPFIDGEAASLTLLCRAGRAHVLAASRQNIVRLGDRLDFAGVEVGGITITDELRALADRIHDALPGLSGIVGVDYVATPDGPVVIEVNPRLTTSYAGLRRSLGVNPAAFVSELIRDGAVPDLPPMPLALPVEVVL
ncbi:ATP-grasp domain-containing protein [Starkeya sp. ORNL1]|uniref:ATP-grasp domain-containing protein n=1 Tax=Starkeya sp. ORNL1 TaxID=2709380 RepID=UPI0014648181|nr:ATP-grasp domain-containing protein [Starkeya sp. ORNL1]QJP13918.1 ATP-grasp domain-containing protein [Starkeya sp. ORNL1]